MENTSNLKNTLLPFIYSVRETLLETQEEYTSVSINTRIYEQEGACNCAIYCKYDDGILPKYDVGFEYNVQETLDGPEEGFISFLANPEYIRSNGKIRMEPFDTNFESYGRVLGYGGTVVVPFDDYGQYDFESAEWRQCFRECIELFFDNMLENDGSEEYTTLLKETLPLIAIRIHNELTKNEGV